MSNQTANNNTIIDLTNNAYPVFKFEQLSDSSQQLIKDYPDFKQNVTCSICYEIVDDPAGHKQCSAIQCKKCIQQSANQNGNCPNCRGSLQEDRRGPINTGGFGQGRIDIPLNKTVIPFLDMLKFKCKQGCNVEIPYSSYKEHINNCPLVQCQDCKTELTNGHDHKACKDSIIDKMLTFIDISMSSSNCVHSNLNNTISLTPRNNQMRNNQMVNEYRTLGSREAKMNFILRNIKINPNVNNQNQNQNNNQNMPVNNIDNPWSNLLNNPQGNNQNGVMGQHQNQNLNNPFQNNLNNNLPSPIEQQMNQQLNQQLNLINQQMNQQPNNNGNNGPINNNGNPFNRFQ